MKPDFSDISSLSEKLTKEAALIAKRLGKNNIQLARRLVIMQVFVLMEALAHLMKQRIQEAYVRNDWQGHVTFEEWIASLGEDHTIQENGDLKFQVKRYRTLPHILFCLRLAAKSNQKKFDHSKINHWQSVKGANEVRNRITHPKSATQLEIKPEEYRLAVQTLRWFNESIRQIV